MQTNDVMPCNYLAHSAKQVKERFFKEQGYESHINNVVAFVVRELKKKEKYVSKRIYPVLEKSVILAAIYHDLGKLDNQSQSVLRGELKSRMLNHVDAGAAHMLNKYHETRDLSFLIAAYLILSHHIGLVNFNYVFKSEEEMLTIIYKETEKFRDRKSLAKYEMGYGEVCEHVDRNLDDYLGKHNSICHVAEPNIKIEKRDAIFFISNPMVLKVAISLLVDADHCDTSKNYGEPYPVREKPLLARQKLGSLLKHVKALQKKITTNSKISVKERMDLRKRFFKACGVGVSEEECENFYLVDGTVGIGKTLGIMNLALRIAIKYDLDTLIFVLPYISLIDQSSTEYIKSILDINHKSDYDINIIHSMYKTKNFFHRKYQRGFNAAVNITTGVNFFNAISSNHANAFKNIHKFIGSVICMDEYDLLCQNEHWPLVLSIMHDLSTHFSCKFIFSSGTPTRFWDIPAIYNLNKTDIEKIKVKDVIGNDFYQEMLEVENKRLKIINSTKEKWSFKTLSDNVLKYNGSIFIVLETKKKAAAFAGFLKTKTDRHIYVRYSSLSFKDRDVMFAKVKQEMANGEPIIFIGTPGSDIGLDVSFRYGFRESGSYFSILQMKGRICRNCEFDDSFLHIFKLREDPKEDGVIYHCNPSFKQQIEIVESNEEVLRSFPPEYCTSAKQEEYKKMSFLKREEMAKHIDDWKDKQFEDLSDNFSLINAPNMSLLVDADIFAKIKKNEFVPYADIQKNIVNLIYSEKEMERIKDLIVPIVSEEDLLVEGEDGEDSIDNEKDNESKKQKGLQKLYFWKGQYDPEMYGVLADPIFGIVDLPTLLV